MILPRTALRLGAKRVDHRLSPLQGPSCLLVSKKSHHAEEEGVKLNLLTTPVAFQRQGWAGLGAGMPAKLNWASRMLRAGEKPVPISGSNFRTSRMSW